MIIPWRMMRPMHHAAFGVVYIFAVKADFIANFQWHTWCQINIVCKQQGLLCVNSDQKFLVSGALVVIFQQFDHSAVAAEMRDGLKNLYSVLKGADEHLKFVFLTGVSKFSKVSLFSGLNNLIDITLDERYSALCGYTDTDRQHEHVD